MGIKNNKKLQGPKDKKKFWLSVRIMKSNSVRQRLFNLSDQKNSKVII